jgi:hypothetical protein
MAELIIGVVLLLIAAVLAHEWPRPTAGIGRIAWVLALLVLVIAGAVLAIVGLIDVIDANTNG